jgi:hypothetical protein
VPYDSSIAAAWTTVLDQRPAEWSIHGLVHLNLGWLATGLGMLFAAAIMRAIATHDCDESMSGMPPSYRRFFHAVGQRPESRKLVASFNCFVLAATAVAWLVGVPIFLCADHRAEEEDLQHVEGRVVAIEPTPNPASEAFVVAGRRFVAQSATVHAGQLVRVSYGEDGRVLLVDVADP